MKLWIDDKRDPPDDSWTVARNSDEALDKIYEEPIEQISFDHDLGEDSKNGLEIAEMICFEGLMPHPSRCSVHSANPVGARRIRNFIADFWDTMTDPKEDLKDKFREEIKE